LKLTLVTLEMQGFRPRFFRFLRDSILLLYGIIRAGSVPLKATTLGRTQIPQYMGQ